MHIYIHIHSRTYAYTNTRTCTHISYTRTHNLTTPVKIYINHINHNIYIRIYTPYCHIFYLVSCTKLTYHQLKKEKERNETCKK